MNPPFGVDPQKACAKPYGLESHYRICQTEVSANTARHCNKKYFTGLRPVGSSYGKLLQAIPSPCRSKSCGSPGPAASKKAWASFWVRKSEQSRSGPLGSNLRFDVDETVLDDGFVVF